MVQIEINGLSKYGLVKTDGYNVEETPAGRLMARYYIAFDTMKIFMEVTGKESLSDLLGLLCRAAEFQDVQLRNDEKGALNALNCTKTGPGLRFPIKGRIKTKPLKINCLVQAVLGGLTIHQPALQQESVRVVRVVERLAKCLVEVLALGSSFGALVSATVLAKCARSKLWEDSPQVGRQLPRIGAVLAQLLVVAGKTSLEAIAKSNPRELERILNRLPPFGVDLQTAAESVPRFSLSVLPAPGTFDQAVRGVVVEVAIVNPGVAACSSQDWLVVIAGDGDNVLFLNEKLATRSLLSKAWNRRLDVSRSSAKELRVHVISENWVGVDLQKTFELAGAASSESDTDAGPPVKNATDRTTKINVTQRPAEQGYLSSTQSRNSKSTATSSVDLSRFTHAATREATLSHCTPSKQPPAARAEFQTPRRSIQTFIRDFYSTPTKASIPSSQFAESGYSSASYSALRETPDRDPGSRNLPTCSSALPVRRRVLGDSEDVDCDEDSNPFPPPGWVHYNWDLGIDSLLEDIFGKDDKTDPSDSADTSHSAYFSRPACSGSSANPSTNSSSLGMGQSDAPQNLYRTNCFGEDDEVDPFDSADTGHSAYFSRPACSGSSANPSTNSSSLGMGQSDAPQNLYRTNSYRGVQSSQIPLNVSTRNSTEICEAKTVKEPSRDSFRKITDCGQVAHDLNPLNEDGYFSPSVIQEFEADFFPADKADEVKERPIQDSTFLSDVYVTEFSDRHEFGRVWQENQYHVDQTDAVENPLPEPLLSNDTTKFPECKAIMNDPLDTQQRDAVEKPFVEPVFSGDVTECTEYKDITNTLQENQYHGDQGDETEKPFLEPVFSGDATAFLECNDVTNTWQENEQDTDYIDDVSREFVTENPSSEPLISNDTTKFPECKAIINDLLDTQQMTEGLQHVHKEADALKIHFHEPVISNDVVELPKCKNTVGNWQESEQSTCRVLHLVHSVGQSSAEGSAKCRDTSHDLRKTQEQVNSLNGELIPSLEKDIRGEGTTSSPPETAFKGETGPDVALPECSREDEMRKLKVQEDVKSLVAGLNRSHKEDTFLPRVISGKGTISWPLKRTNNADPVLTRRAVTVPLVARNEFVLPEIDTEKAMMEIKAEAAAHSTANRGRKLWPFPSDATPARHNVRLIQLREDRAKVSVDKVDDMISKILNRVKQPETVRRPTSQSTSAHGLRPSLGEVTATQDKDMRDAALKRNAGPDPPLPKSELQAECSKEEEVRKLKVQEEVKSLVAGLNPSQKSDFPCRVRGRGTTTSPLRAVCKWGDSSRSSTPQNEDVLPEIDLQESTMKMKAEAAAYTPANQRRKLGSALSHSVTKGGVTVPVAQADIIRNTIIKVLGSERVSLGKNSHGNPTSSYRGPDLHLPKSELQAECSKEEEVRKLKVQEEVKSLVAGLNPSQKSDFPCRVRGRGTITSPLRAVCKRGDSSRSSTSQNEAVLPEIGFQGAMMKMKAEAAAYTTADQRSKLSSVSVARVDTMSKVLGNKRHSLGEIGQGNPSSSQRTYSYVRPDVNYGTERTSQSVPPLNHPRSLPSVSLRLEPQLDYPPQYGAVGLSALKNFQQSRVISRNELCRDAPEVKRPKRDTFEEMVLGSVPLPPKRAYITPGKENRAPNKRVPSRTECPLIQAPYSVHDLSPRTDRGSADFLESDTECPFIPADISPVPCHPTLADCNRDEFIFNPTRGHPPHSPSPVMSPYIGSPLASPRRHPEPLLERSWYSHHSDETVLAQNIPLSACRRPPRAVSPDVFEDTPPLWQPITHSTPLQEASCKQATPSPSHWPSARPASESETKITISDDEDDFIPPSQRWFQEKPRDLVLALSPVQKPSRSAHTSKWDRFVAPEAENDHQSRPSVRREHLPPPDSNSSQKFTFM